MVTLLLSSMVLAQSGPFRPLEDIFERISVGPELSAAAAVDRFGAGPQLGLGLQLALFDVEKIPEPRCAEHHRHEREQLGGREGEPWDEFIARVQQECPAIAEKTRLDYSALIETALSFRRAGLEGGVRAVSSIPPLTFGNFSVQLSSTIPFATTSGDLRIGFRLGPELTWFQRFKVGGWRPVLQPFVRGEATLFRRDEFADQLSGGVRFLFDL